MLRREELLKPHKRNTFTLSFINVCAILLLTIVTGTLCWLICTINRSPIVIKFDKVEEEHCELGSDLNKSELNPNTSEIMDSKEIASHDFEEHKIDAETNWTELK